MFNPARGDVQIVMAQATWVLRPSFAAIVMLEEKTGQGIFEFARGFAQGKNIRAQDIKMIIEAGLQGNGSVLPDNLDDIIITHGLANFLSPLGNFLVRACGIDADEIK